MSKHKFKYDDSVDYDEYEESSEVKFTKPDTKRYDKKKQKIRDRRKQKTAQKNAFFDNGG